MYEKSSTMAAGSSEGSAVGGAPPVSYENLKAIVGRSGNSMSVEFA